MSITPLVVEKQIHFDRRGRGARKEMLSGVDPRPPLPPGRVPRIARLLALAHRFEQLLQEGIVTDYAHLARLGHVTRARLTQIMNLLLLSPAIQEEILFAPLTLQGRDPLTVANLQPIALEPDWNRQQQLWQVLRAAMNQ